jgi:hypothetical protein
MTLVKRARELDAMATADIKGRATEVCVTARGEVVILGSPVGDDESHNCDAMGCGQCHVLWRSGKWLTFAKELEHE